MLLSFSLSTFLSPALIVKSSTIVASVTIFKELLFSTLLNSGTVSDSAISSI
jgi:hypothetical protein